MHANTHESHTHKTLGNKNRFCPVSKLHWKIFRCPFSSQHLSQLDSKPWPTGSDLPLASARGQARLPLQTRDWAICSQ